MLIKFLMTMLLSCVPLIELKGSIPLGTASGLTLEQAFLAGLIGSCLPVPLLLLFLKPVMAWLHKFTISQRFVHWLENRVLKKSHDVHKSKSVLWFIFIFVAIPLPTTGVWTGAMIASYLDVPFKKALPAIVLGNVVAGACILALTALGVMALS